MKIKINLVGLVTVSTDTNCIYIGSLSETGDDYIRKFLPSKEGIEKFGLISKDFEVENGFEEFMNWVLGFEPSFKVSTYPCNEECCWTTRVQVNIPSLDIKATRTKHWGDVEPTWQDIQKFADEIQKEIRNV